MKTNFFIRAVMIAATFFTINLYSQVTIGNDSPPVKGALLDLKMTEEGLSTKGLGLPRVKLIKLADNDVSNTIEGVSPNTYTGNHTGLVVYNVSSIPEDHCTGIMIPPGVYVWKGTEWEPLGKVSITGVSTLFDSRDGETYYTGSFGDAGEWMLENLRYIGDLTISKSSEGIDAKSYFYPQPGAGAETNPDNIPSYYTRQGLLYTWMAATNGENTVLADQGQASGTTPGTNEVEYTGPHGTAPKKYVRGICPEGWHLPSDREWNELERVIYTNPKEYSTVTQNFNPSSWSSSWESGNSGVPIYWRPNDNDNGQGEGHGTAMKSSCVLSGHSHGSPYGKSKPIFSGGFEALLTGLAFRGKMVTQEAGLTGTFGDSGYFWTSSVFDSQRAWRRTVVHERIFVLRANHTAGVNRDWLMSVRCKKNE